MILNLGYIGLSILMTVILVLIGLDTIEKTFNDTSTARKKRLTLILSLLLWHVYIFTIASTGILQNYEFPPKFLLLLILPAFLFTGVFIYKNRKSEWLRNIPEHWLIYYQTFRILIEILFVFSVTRGIVHWQMTIHGYNFDLIFATSALIIGFLVFQKKMLAKKAALWWNYLGLAVIAVIIFLVQSAIYLPEIYGSDVVLLPKEFVMYPYVLVAGFLMPSAVFIHVLSIVQLGNTTEHKHHS
ncbi:MAG: hypothetical protein JKY18_10265 [Flavobacteriales bacterium]|nr:hypothetical protein [Flavobacteriales bacterium]